MRYTLGLMILIGMASGAAWYRADDPARAKVAKILVPDPGPDDSLALDQSLKFPALDIDLLEPVEKLPSQFIAELEPLIRSISDEQPFAVSEETEPEPAAAQTKPHSSPASRTSRRRTTEPKPEPAEGRSELVPIEPVDTEPQTVTRSSSERGEAPKQTPKTEQPSGVQLEEPVADLELKESVEGRPISVRRMGQGRYRTLIVAGLDGRDRTGTRWADELTDALELRPDLLEQQEFVIVRAANPDGLAVKTRLNARGVDLNRNFPTRRYRTDGPEPSGSGPASEPETRALLETMYELKPQRVVHLCSSASQSVAFVNQSAGDVAERLQRRFGVPGERLNYDRMPGSLEEFVEGTWSSSVVLLQLRGVPEPEVSRRLLPIMLAAVAKVDLVARPGQPSPVSNPRGQMSRWPTGPQSSPVPLTAPAYQNERRTRPVVRRGYEELPPPPE